MPEIKTNFMEWLDGETARRGRQDAVAALLQELRIETQLADLRRKRGMTQAELARKMGVKQPLVARLEGGQSRNLTLTTIMKAALILDADVELRIRPRRISAQERRRQIPATRGTKMPPSRNSQDAK